MKWGASGRLGPASIPLCWCWRRGLLAAIGVQGQLLPLRRSGQLLTIRAHQAVTVSGPSAALAYLLGIWQPKRTASAGHRVLKIEGRAEESLGEMSSQDLQPFLSSYRTWVTWPTLGGSCPFTCLALVPG